MKLTMLKPRLASIKPVVRVLQQTRNPEAKQRIRGRRWMAIRARWLSDNPLCVRCQAKGLARPASQLDHVIPLIDGGKDCEANYQSLCNQCHKDKTAAEAASRAGGRVKSLKG